MSVFISLFTIALNAILAENFILVKFMGICPFMGVSKKQDTALGMGIAVTFVMGIASAATWAVIAGSFMTGGVPSTQSTVPSQRSAAETPSTISFMRFI